MYNLHQPLGSVGDRPYQPGGTLFALGTSHEQGQLALATSWAPGGTVPPEYRWLNILASQTGMTLVNHGVSGSRFSSSFATSVDRRSHFNQLRLLPVNWSGAVICQGGYNDTYNELAVATWGTVFPGVWDAWIARALLAGWVCPNGVRHDGAAHTFATTGTLANEGNPEANSFHRGDPANDPRQVITLSGSQTATVVNPVAGTGVVFLGAAAAGGGFGAGGTCRVTVDGVLWGTASTVLVAGSTVSELPVAVVLRGVPAGASIVVTNTSGTTRILAYGWVLPPEQVMNRAVIVGTPPSFGSPNRSALMLAMIGRNALAAAHRWSDYRVYAYALNDLTAADAEPGDPDHPSPDGNRHIARCALAATRGPANYLAANPVEGLVAANLECGARGSSPAVMPFPWIYFTFSARGYITSWNGAAFAGMTLRATHVNIPDRQLGIGFDDGTTPPDDVALHSLAGRGLSICHVGFTNVSGNWVGARVLAGAGAGVSPGLLLRRANGVASQHCQTWVGHDPTTTPADFVIRHGTATTANNDPTAVPEVFRLRADGRWVIGAAGVPLLRLRFGTATLVGGTVTVNDANITNATIIIPACQTPGGTPGFLRISARSVGVSFTIQSSSGTDTSIVGYSIFEP